MSVLAREALAFFLRENRGFAGKGGRGVAPAPARHAIERGLRREPDRPPTGQGRRRFVACPP